MIPYLSISIFFCEQMPIFQDSGVRTAQNCWNDLQVIQGQWKSHDSIITFDFCSRICI